MQGTIATFDADTRGGTLLLDDGTELAFEGAAFDGSGLRRLRLGQRIDVHLDAAGVVQAVRISGIS
ncbi:MAG TPA: cold-shock protein [Actinoplanes sp.]|jgi:2-phospho-L-lactate guanylyltransferase